MNQPERRIVNAIRSLGQDDLGARLSARELLERAGPDATWHLLQVLDPPSERTRREAIKILAHRADPVALDAFVEALEDEDSACRWHAAEGLVGLGQRGLDQELELLESYPKNDLLLRATHHVLQGLAATGYASIVSPILHAFQSTTPQIDVPAAVSRAQNREQQAENTTPIP